MEKRIADIEAYYMKRAKDLDATFAADNNSNIFVSANKSYGINRIDKVNRRFKQPLTRWFQNHEKQET